MQEIWWVQGSYAVWKVKATWNSTHSCSSCQSTSTVGHVGEGSPDYTNPGHQIIPAFTFSQLRTRYWGTEAKLPSIWRLTSWIKETVNITKYLLYPRSCRFWCGFLCRNNIWRTIRGNLFLILTLESCYIFSIQRSIQSIYVFCIAVHVSLSCALLWMPRRQRPCLIHMCCPNS